MTGDQTPDVNRDGSLKRSDTDDDWGSEDSTSWTPTISWEAIGVRLRTLFVTIPQILSLATVLLGAYNLLVIPFLEIELYSGYRAIVLSFTDVAIPAYLIDILLIAAGSISVWITTRT